MVRWGVVAFADSLDCVGIIAKDVATARRVFGEIFEILNWALPLNIVPAILSFHDPKDPTAATSETRRTCSEVLNERMKYLLHSDDLTGLRVGVPIVGLSFCETPIFYALDFF
jgi:aspartyl-tRNA(Asn)/glutamyl-tRNA(Gln) amidotransferase subunit A